ncbi:MAG: tRNA (guanosine(37)-N1)-methyltransferase TrmD [bacterium]|nr:tRNA (guanosine(37)-N1)-methyltransferase TrmD [bacterium]
MRIDVITPFPGMFEAIFAESMLRQASLKERVRYHVWDLRDFAEDRHRTVDDYPYGGGAGMILKPEPIFRCIEAIRGDSPGAVPRVLLMSPQGETFSQTKAASLAAEPQLVFLCGHYRGVDERVIESLVDEEISIGDYILSGGELAAAVIIDAVVRLQPGVLGNSDSADGDSFVSGRLDHPHYTRPEEFRGLKVPDVLLSGHHARIDAWREEQALRRTAERRPDLLKRGPDGLAETSGSSDADGNQV